MTPEDRRALILGLGRFGAVVGPAAAAAGAQTTVLAAAADDRIEAIAKDWKADAR